MRDLSTLTFHPTAEKLVKILCEQTQNANPMFFRISVSYYLAKVAATMRVKIATQDRGEIPVNLYAINLAPSGQGKGHSTNIIEDQVIHQFRSTFFDQTYPLVCEENLAKLAAKRAYINGEDIETEELAVIKEFKELGKLAFSFDSATTAAVKQMRHKLLMADIGAVNLEMDEAGSNLVGNTEVLNTFLELFDVGKVKQKLIKNTKENTRSEEIEGKTPTNLLLYGVPVALLDGGKIETEFMKFLSIGYGRRCLFGYTEFAQKDKSLTAEQIYDMLTDKSSINYLKDLSLHFGKLANILNFNKVITMSKAVSILLIEYRLHCENLADGMAPIGEEIRKTEISHRYFKALKLAGAYAFIDGQPEVTEENLYAAIKMVEESGKAFERLLKQDKAYAKIAKYIASVPAELTHVDLAEALPFYKGSQTQKAELMQLAIAWGYKHSVIIKRAITNNIEFITGETLAKTTLDSMIVSHSHDISDGYENVNAPWDKLYNLVEKPHHHFINHHLTTGHREECNICPGSNMIVLDIDGGASMETVKLLLKDYQFLMYTTKRHTAQHHRFRVIMPINYHVTLGEQEYKDFMRNIFEWLPFDVDVQTGQRSRKWLTHDGGTYEYSKGEKILDAMLFIPNTAKNDERQKIIMDHSALNSLERWFVQNSASGNRNNQLIRYALVLVDMGGTVDQIKNNVLVMNKKLSNPLPESEIDSTIMVTASKALMKRGSA